MSASDIAIFMILDFFCFSLACGMFLLHPVLLALHGSWNLQYFEFYLPSPPAFAILDLLILAYFPSNEHTSATGPRMRAKEESTLGIDAV